MQWKITMSSLSISSNTSSSLEVEVKWLVLEEELSLSLEEDIFGLKWKEKCLKWTLPYIALNPKPKLHHIILHCP